MLRFIVEVALGIGLYALIALTALGLIMAFEKLLDKLGVQ